MKKKEKIYSDDDNEDDYAWLSCGDRSRNHTSLAPYCDERADGDPFGGRAFYSDDLDLCDRAFDRIHGGALEPVWPGGHPVFNPVWRTWDCNIYDYPFIGTGEKDHFKRAPAFTGCL